MEYEIKYIKDLDLMETKVEGLKNPKILAQILDSVIKESANHGTRKYLFDTRRAVGEFRISNLRNLIDRFDQIGFKKTDNFAVLCDFTSIEADTAILIANIKGWNNFKTFTYRDEALEWLQKQSDEISSIAN